MKVARVSILVIPELIIAIIDNGTMKINVNIAIMANFGDKNSSGLKFIPLFPLLINFPHNKVPEIYYANIGLNRY